MLNRISRGFQLRCIGGRFDGYDDLGLSAHNSFTRENGMSLTSMLNIAACVMLLCFAVATMFAGHAHGMASSHGMTALGFAFAGITGTKTGSKTGTPEKKPAKIREMEANLKALAKELEVGQAEMIAGPISNERGDELEEKAQEMEDLQGHIDRYNKIAGIVGKSREVEKVTLPGGGDINTKTIFTTPGHLFVASQALANFKSQGQQGWSSKVEVGRRLGKKTMLRGEDAIEFERKAYDPATLSSLGDDAIIAVDRDPEIVKYQNDEILTIRDVLNVVPTTSDAIRYVKHISTTRGAATQNPARGGLKAYLKVAFEPATVSVETIAVLSKVTEQDVSDSARLVGMINGEMSLDVRVEEERQLVWGDGTSGSLVGLFDPATDMPEFTRADTGDTIIDIIRRMRTDLRKKRVQPNFALIDPLDWEEIELAKGTDLRYIWGVVTDIRGPRIWSLQVVESDAMTNLETNERRVCVGDGIRGATIYDREQVQLAVGFVDDDFARNLRTLRAEERIALAVKRPWSFEFAITAEPES